ncbi:MAG: peptide deformylase [Thermaerobacter sp.]|nr:peptide deformylase [Thermaerobacter sp.]
MALREILLYGDERLRRKARPARTVNRQLRRLLDDLAQTMYASKGVGLAATQIGEEHRVMVVDVGEGLWELVNPVVVRRAGKLKAVEGCLSVPQYLGEVERAERVVVEALDRRGRRVWVEGEGWLARALQHELDHLDGVLFLDRAERIMDNPPPGEGEEQEQERENEEL